MLQLKSKYPQIVVAQSEVFMKYLHISEDLPVMCTIECLFK